MVINKKMAGKRETRQKKAIESEINKIKTFFNAEEIYNNLKKTNPGIGIATVYRFLKDMQKNREIHSFTCDRKSLYSKKGMSHSHFVCEICGKTEHINLDKIDFVKKIVSGKICHVQLEVSGICNSCKS